MQKQHKVEVKTSMRVAFENIRIPATVAASKLGIVNRILDAFDNKSGIKRKGKLWRVVRRGKQ